MASAFEHHGVTHLSPSKLNLFTMQPALCLLEIAGIKDRALGPAVWRGSAIDKVSGVLAEEPDAPEEQLMEVAAAEFNEREANAEGDFGDKIEKERDSLSKYISNARPLFTRLHKEHGAPKDQQGKVKVQLGFSVPVIGYYDLLYEDCVRDVKTGRVMKELNHAAKRQVSVYANYTEVEPFVDYIGTTSTLSHGVPDHQVYLEDLMNAGFALEAMLGRSEDIKEVCRTVYPDFDHWIWTPKMIEAARGIWND